MHERINLPSPGDELEELADIFDAMERLDRSFDGQRGFVANTSDEVRTPLAVNRTLREVTFAHPNLSPGRGVGSGLSIVRSIARTDGGDARAVARTDGGLEVRVLLPAAGY